MPIQQIIDDLKAMGEDEVATKLHFMWLGFNRPESFTTDVNEANEIADLFLWGTSPEGHGYWRRIHHALADYRYQRDRSTP